MKENEQNNNIFEEETCITDIGLSNLKSAAFFKTLKQFLKSLYYRLRLVNEFSADLSHFIFQSFAITFTWQTVINNSSRYFFGTSQSDSNLF